MHRCGALTVGKTFNAKESLKAYLARAVTPAQIYYCGYNNNCAFHVSAAGLLTQEQKSEGACAVDCGRNGGPRGEGYLGLDWPPSDVGITDIAPGAFTNLSHVTYILFGDNLFTSLKTGTFTGANLPAVTLIDFGMGTITGIEVGAITGLPMLRENNFGNKTIENIEAGAITNTSELDIV